MRSDIFWEGKSCSRDVLIQLVDIISIGICRVVIKGQIPSQHSVLQPGSVMDIELAAGEWPY